MTMTATPLTCRAATTSPMKSADPGVSRRLTLAPFHGKGAIAVCTEMPRAISSGEWSLTDLPPSTGANLGTTLPRTSACSTREVLPVPP